MKRNYGKIVIGMFCLILCVGGIACLLIEKGQKAGNVDIYEELQEEHGSILGQVDLNVEIKPDIPVDFEELKGINEDIYAWIDIEDTNVHYPIVQSATDDSYYLEHTIEGVKGLPGSIYTESVNSKDFSDYITLIYGHDMRDGSMFKHLHKFADADFFEEHETVMIYTEDAIHEYRIYAAVAYDNRHIMYSFEQSNAEDRAAFIDSLHAARNMKNQYREDMEIDAESKLIVMSTCITGQPDKRWIVVAAEVCD